MTAFPHSGPALSLWQVAEHPSPLELLPSSHCSGGATWPSPHVGPAGWERQATTRRMEHTMTRRGRDELEPGMQAGFHLVPRTQSYFAHRGRVWDFVRR